jgi:hypothetical protein
MKNYITVTLLLVLFSSCGLLQPRGGNLRLVKVGEKEEVLIERNQEHAKIQRDNPPAVFEIATVEVANTVESNLEEANLEKTENRNLDYRRVVHESEKIEPEEVEPTDQQKVDMAMQAEKQANTSFYLFLSGLISVIMPLVGIILFVFGLSNFMKASNSRFITPFGEERLRVAKVFLIIDAVILLFYISLILLIILLI